MTTRLVLPLALALVGLSGCAVYTPAGYGAVYGTRGASVHMQAAPVIIAPATVHARPHYRSGDRRDRYRYRDRDGSRRDRDGDGVVNRFDRQPDNPWRH